MFSRADLGREQESSQMRHAAILQTVGNRERRQQACPEKLTVFLTLKRSMRVVATPSMYRGSSAPVMFHRGVRCATAIAAAHTVAAGFSAIAARQSACRPVRLRCDPPAVLLAGG